MAESEAHAVGVAGVVVVVTARRVHKLEVRRIAGVWRARPPVGRGSLPAQFTELDPKYSNQKSGRFLYLFRSASFTPLMSLASSFRRLAIRSVAFQTLRFPLLIFLSFALL